MSANNKQVVLAQRTRLAVLAARVRELEEACEKIEMQAIAGMAPTLADASLKIIYETACDALRKVRRLG